MSTYDYYWQEQTLYVYYRMLFEYYTNIPVSYTHLDVYKRQVADDIAVTQQPTTA